MKSYTVHYLVIFCLVGFYGFCQQTHPIKLTCSTAELTEENFDTVCNFGQEERIPNKDFSIDAQKSDIVIWSGAFSDIDSGMIDIVSIDYESGTNIFKDRHIYDREDGMQDGKIVAIIKRGEDGDQLKYKIKFDAYDRAGDFIGRFTIDPKIRIRRFTSRLERN